MITVKFTMDEERNMASLHMNGHADAGDVGHDIICASASILAYTLAQNLLMVRSKGILKYDPQIKLKRGKAVITCRAVSEDDYAEILHIFLIIQTGFQLLAHNYPEYVVLTMFGEATEP